MLPNSSSCLYQYSILAQDANFTFSSSDFVNITGDASLRAETGMTIECWVN